MNRDITLLRFILDAAENVQAHISCNAADFTKERAIGYELIALGEAVKDISPELKKQHSHIPWQQISGTRDRLAHDYEDVSSQIIWNIAKIHLPALVADVEAILITLETK
jgi:uncharacterized protein with HEPN domain